MTLPLYFVLKCVGATFLDTGSFVFIYVSFKKFLLTTNSYKKKYLNLMENIEIDVTQKQRDKRFYMITLAVFLPLAAVLKVYFFLR